MSKGQMLTLILMENIVLPAKVYHLGSLNLRDSLILKSESFRRIVSTTSSAYT